MGRERAVAFAQLSDDETVLTLVDENVRDDGRLLMPRPPSRGLVTVGEFLQRASPFGRGHELLQFQFPRLKRLRFHRVPVLDCVVATVQCSVSAPPHRWKQSARLARWDAFCAVC